MAESFCQYVVGSDAELFVGDAASDPRTRDTPSIEKMQTGDTLVLYTDGVTDARKGRGRERSFFGAERLRRLIAASTAATADALAAEIERAAKDFTDGPLRRGARGRRDAREVRLAEPGLAADVQRVVDGVIGQAEVEVPVEVVRPPVV